MSGFENTNTISETEYKFLVDQENEDFRKKISESVGVRIVQAYLHDDPEKTVRIRDYGGECYITVKGSKRNGGLTGVEVTSRISKEQFNVLLDLCDGVIEKVRHKIEYAGNIFEVDFFHNGILVLAELEIDEDVSFKTPSWVIEDVTGNPLYFNSNMKRMKYSGLKQK